MKKIKYFIILILFSPVFLFAQDRDDIVATFQDQKITRGELDNRLEELYGRKILEQMIEEKIILKEAENRKIKITDEEIEKEFKNIENRYSSKEEFQKVMKENELTEETLKKRICLNLVINKLREDLEKEFKKEVFVTSEEIEKYFQKNRDKYLEVRARHILVDTKEKAEKILQELKEGKDFSELAKKYSKCPSKEKGGDLGFFGKNVMVKEFENSAFSLKVGEISQPVKTKFGYHIIKLEEKRGEKLEEVKDKVKEEITNEKISEKIKEWFEKLKKDANIKISL
jgi:foldase protein PrsA